MSLPKITTATADGEYVAPRAFPIGPFKRYEHNPIMTPNTENKWESAYLYNATAIVLEDKVYLLYRAQDEAKVSSVGLAWLEDGYNFTRYPEPVLSPTEEYELAGGCEDPRVVRDPTTKKFVLTYTAYDGKLARMCVATSEDLVHWEKHGPVIEDDNWYDIVQIAAGDAFQISAGGEPGDQFVRKGWLKSGAIFTEKLPQTGKYHMVWGDSAMHLAQSDDLVHWELPAHTFHENLFTKGLHVWQNRLVEPGPAPIKLDAGNRNLWVLFYNSSTLGGGAYPTGTYTLSQMLIDYDNIEAGPVAREDKPFLAPVDKNEVEGQVDQVVFTEGIVQFKGKWFLYFGQADSELGVATANI